MPYDPDRLRVIGYAGGFTLWHYGGGASGRPGRGPDDDMLAPGFFDAAADLLRAGDFVFASGNAAHAILVVSEIGAGRVTLAPLAAVTPRRSGRRRRQDPAAGVPSPAH